jgi:hypothetical protein
MEHFKAYFNNLISNSPLITIPMITYFGYLFSGSVSTFMQLINSTKLKHYQCAEPHCGQRSLTSGRTN